MTIKHVCGGSCGKSLVEEAMDVRVVEAAVIIGAGGGGWQGGGGYNR